MKCKRMILIRYTTIQIKKIYSDVIIFSAALAGISSQSLIIFFNADGSYLCHLIKESFEALFQYLFLASAVTQQQGSVRPRHSRSLLLHFPTSTPCHHPSPPLALDLICTQPLGNEWKRQDEQHNRTGAEGQACASQAYSPATLQA